MLHQTSLFLVMHKLKVSANEFFFYCTIVNAFADVKLNIDKLMVFVRMEENIVGKNKKCWLPAFSSFPTMFKKASYTGSFKVVIV